MDARLRARLRAGAVTRRELQRAGYNVTTRKSIVMRWNVQDRAGRFAGIANSWVEQATSTICDSTNEWAFSSTTQSGYRWEWVDRVWGPRCVYCNTRSSDNVVVAPSSAFPEIVFCDYCTDRYAQDVGEW